MDDEGDGAGGARGVRLAVAILLLWLAGVCLWIAFEGTTILPDKLPVGPGGKPSYFLGVLQGLGSQAQKLEQQGYQAKQGG
jgi:hypothetical protein